jgi:hypothetical protein
VNEWSLSSTSVFARLSSHATAAYEYFFTTSTSNICAENVNDADKTDMKVDSDSAAREHNLNPSIVALKMFLVHCHGSHFFLFSSSYCV